MTTTTTESVGHAAAPAPKSGSSYTMEWGLLAIPVKLFTGNEASATVARKQFTPDGHPVGSRAYDKVTLENFDGEPVMKVEVGKDEFVELSNEEIEAAIGETIPPGSMKIETFIPLDSIMREYVVEKVDQVRPAERKVGTKKIRDEAADKAFSLLMTAMRERQVAALVAIPRRGASSYGAVMPDGRFAYLRFAEQVRETLPMPEASHSEAEMALAQQLIEQVGIDTPVLEDKATARVREYVEAKAAGVKPKAVKKAKATAEVVDLTAALAASLKAA